MCQDDWLGNIWEIDNLIDRAIIENESETIRPDLFYLGDQ